MYTPVNLWLWLSQLIWPLVFVLLAVAAVVLLLKLSVRKRIRKLNQARAGTTQQTFTEEMERFGFDPVIVASTYRYLQEVQGVQFPIVSTDILDDDLGLDSDDIAQTVRELSVALNRAQTPGVRVAPLVTVEDVIRLLQASPRTRSQVAVQSSSAAA